MSKKTFTLFLSVFIALLFSIALVPTFAAEFTDNKCYEEWDCGDGSTDESLYWWEAGWCAAAIESGIVNTSIADCTSSPDDDLIIIIEEEDDDEDGKKRKRYKGLRSGCYAYIVGEGIEAAIDWDGGEGPRETDVYLHKNCKGSPLGSNTLATDSSKLSCEEPLIVSSVTLDNGKKIYVCGDE